MGERKASELGLWSWKVPTKVNFYLWEEWISGFKE